MPRTKTKDLTAKVEGLVDEIAALKAQRDEALLAVQRAEQRFEEISARRAEVSPKVFAGDEKAALELEGLDREYESLARSSSVASDAVPQIERMIDESQAELEAVEKDLAAEELSRLLAELSATEEHSKSLLAELREDYNHYSNLYREAMEKTRVASGEHAEASMAMQMPLSLREYLRRFGNAL